MGVSLISFPNENFLCRNGAACSDGDELTPMMLMGTMRNVRATRHRLESISGTPEWEWDDFVATRPQCWSWLPAETPFTRLTLACGGGAAWEMASETTDTVGRGLRACATCWNDIRRIRLEDAVYNKARKIYSFIRTFKIKYMSMHIVTRQSINWQQMLILIKY